MGTTLTIEQQTAHAIYGNDYERVQRCGDGFRTFAARQRLASARSALDPAGRAVMDLVAGAGISPGEVARRSDKSRALIVNLYVSSLDLLAQHYAGQGDAAA